MGLVTNTSPAPKNSLVTALIQVDLEQGSNTGDHDTSHHVSHGDYSCYMILKKRYKWKSASCVSDTKGQIWQAVGCPLSILPGAQTCNQEVPEPFGGMKKTATCSAGTLDRLQELGL